MKLKAIMAAFTAASTLLLPSVATAYEQQIGNSVWSFTVYEKETGELEATVNSYRQVDEKGNMVVPTTDFALTVPASFTVTWTNEFIKVSERVYDEWGNFLSNKYVTVRGPKVKSAIATVTGVSVYNDYDWDYEYNPETSAWEWVIANNYLGRLTALTLPSTVEWVGGFNYCTNLKTVTMSDSTYWSGDVFYESPYIKSLGDFVIRNGVLVAYQGESASVTVPDGVREIGYYAFANAPTNLTSVTLPANVKVIGDYAFGECENLTSINLPEGLTYIGESAFENCYSLTAITIPSHVKYIGYGAFAETAISSINVPDGVKSLSGSFAYCRNLTAVTLPTSLKRIGYEAFYRCSALATITLPNGITSIGDEVFERCTALTSIAIPDSVESISYGAFYGCTNLATVTGGRGVTYVGSDAFGDTALESKWPENGICQAGTMILGYNGTLPEKLVIPTGATYIHNNAFQYGDIEELELPASVHTIGHLAFYGCYNLKSVTGGAGLRYVGSSAFEDTPYENTFWNKDYRGNKDIPFEYIRLGHVVFGYKGVCPAAVTIPDDVTQIQYSLFDRDYDDSVTNITSVVIGAKLEELPTYAFYGAENLKSVTGGVSLTTIRDSVFYGCQGLTAFTIPENVESIDDSVFYNCTNLVMVTGGGALDYIYATFYDCPNLTDISLTGPLTEIDEPFGGSTTNIVNLTFNLPEDVYHYEDYDECDECSPPGYNEFSLSSWMFDGLDKLASVKVLRTGYELVNWKGWANGPLPESFANELATFKLKYKWWYHNGTDYDVESLEFYPVWKRALRNVETDGVFTSADKTVYQGWLTDESGNVIGSVTVTAAKGRNGESKTKAAVQVLGERKVNLNGTIDANGAGTGALAGLVLGANGLSGTLKVNGKTYTADGARDVNKTKKDVAQTTLNALNDKTWTVVLRPASSDISAYANGFLGFSVVMGTKGKAKITGVMPDGVKVSLNAQTIVGETSYCIPVVFSKKDSLGFLFWLDLEGNAKDVTSISDWKSTAIRGASFTVPLEVEAFANLSPLSGTVPFSVAREDLPASLAGVIAEYLPEYEPIAITGNKWTLAKPAMIKYTKGAFDQAAYEKGVAQGKTNISGVKLSYVAKGGSFKGSFTIYTLTGGKLKKVKATVNGVVSDGIGYGAAQIKKFGSMPVVIGDIDDIDDYDD